WQARIAAIQRRLEAGLAAAREFDTVADVRVLGAIGVIEMKAPVDLARIQKQFVDRGVWVRPFGKLVYLMPPYVIDDMDLDALCDAVVGVVRNDR
ncbi:aminotransferase class III-fold pyridoxal phosphate-dependent enzyme, partial [Porticoccus sp.]